MGNKKEKKITFNVTSDLLKLVDNIINDKATKSNSQSQFCTEAIMEYAQRSHKEHWEEYVNGYDKKKS